MGSCDEGINLAKETLVFTEVFIDIISMFADVFIDVTLMVLQLYIYIFIYGKRKF